MDFYEIKIRKCKDGHFDIYPEFIVGDYKDLMIRGKDFYAFYDDSKKMWNRNSKQLQKVIDTDLWNKLTELKQDIRYEGTRFELKLLREESSGSWNRFTKFVKNLPDDYHQLDEKLTFLDTETKREDYASKRLPYSIQEGDISAYDELI